MQPTIHGYFVAIGSNIAPEQHLPIIITHLTRSFGRLWLSSILHTTPHQMDSASPFLNAVCLLPTQQPQATLKQQLVTLEQQLGRNRNDPLKKIKDRAADLDILFYYPGHGPLPSRQIPSEPYIAPMFLELAGYLGLLPPTPPPTTAAALTANGCPIGTTPTELYYQDGRLSSLLSPYQRSNIAPESGMI